MGAPAPSWFARAKALVVHGARILFYTYPEYDFDDLAALQDGLDGPSFRNAAELLRADPDGRRLLEERPDLGIHTVDWQALSGLPIDTFGYNVWHHFHTNGIMVDVKLSPSVVPWDAEAEFAKERYRATHDVRHVILGVGIEGWQEVVLQAFQCAQLFQKLSVMIVVGGGLKHGLIDGRWREILAGVPRAWRVGRRSRFLLHMPCESLWATPLEEVRRDYGITAVGDCYPVSARHPDAGQPVRVAS